MFHGGAVPNDKPASKITQWMRRPEVGRSKLWPLSPTLALIHRFSPFYVRFPPGVVPQLNLETWLVIILMFTSGQPVFRPANAIPPSLPSTFLAVYLRLRLLKIFSHLPICDAVSERGENDPGSRFQSGQTEDIVRNRMKRCHSVP